MPFSGLKKIFHLALLVVLCRRVGFKMAYSVNKYMEISSTSLAIKGNANKNHNEIPTHTC